MTEDKLTKMKWYVRTQNQREKSVSEKIIKEGEIGELVGSRTSSCSFRKTFYLKIIKKYKEKQYCFLVIFLCKQVH
jgi:hypothetical protein